MKVLMVLTSHDKLGDTGRKTGFWLVAMKKMLRDMVAKQIGRASCRERV